MTPEKKKPSSGKNLIKILSVITAFLCWLFVASVGSTVRNRTITNVPVDITIQERILSELNLNVIEIEQTEVVAQVKGERIAVGRILPADITATLKIPANIETNAENEFELALVPLNAISLGNENYEIVSYTPSHIRVKLDQMESKTLSITTNISGEIIIAEGLIQQKAAVLNPKSIVISGPKQEVDKVAKAQVSFNIMGELSESYIEDHEIELVDAEGKVIDLTENHLKINDNIARVVIPVLKQRSLPLTVGFINIPRNFPTEKLDYKRSNEEIDIAGNSEEIDRYSEIILGYIDIHKLSIENNVFDFNINLPDNFVNIENLQTATVTFDVDNWAETTLDITDIKLSNPPDGYNVELIKDTVSGVLFVGEKNALEELTTEDLIAEINFAEKKEISVGQYRYPVSISAPAKSGMVWANGEYSLVVKMTKIEN